MLEILQVSSHHMRSFEVCGYLCFRNLHPSSLTVLCCFSASRWRLVFALYLMHCWLWYVRMVDDDCILEFISKWQHHTKSQVFVKNTLQMFSQQYALNTLFTRDRRLRSNRARHIVVGQSWKRCYKLEHKSMSNTDSLSTQTSSHPSKQVENFRQILSNVNASKYLLTFGTALPLWYSVSVHKPQPTIVTLTSHLRASQRSRNASVNSRMNLWRVSVPTGSNTLASKSSGTCTLILVQCKSISIPGL